jgi:hypothetical protein
VEKKMKTSRLIAIALTVVLMPVGLFAAGFKDLDTAVSSISRGFERGDSQAIVAGIDNGDQVMLQFPGLTEKSGFFGRDQAGYLLDEVFQKAHPVRFQQISALKVSAQNQYNITAAWTYRMGDKTEERELYITLRNKDNSWSIASIRASR